MAEVVVTSYNPSGAVLDNEARKRGVSAVPQTEDSTAGSRFQGRRSEPIPSALRAREPPKATAATPAIFPRQFATCRATGGAVIRPGRSRGGVISFRSKAFVTAHFLPKYVYMPVLKIGRYEMRLPRLHNHGQTFLMKSDSRNRRTYAFKFSE
jgi:hypothetical protein